MPRRKNDNSAQMETCRFDFADGDDKNKEHAYNGNGALTMDLNRSIDNIEYDLLGNPIKLTMEDNTKRIEYVYAADGRRLKTKHSYISYVTKPRLHREIFSDSIEYIGNQILKNGKSNNSGKKGLTNAELKNKAAAEVSQKHQAINDFQTKGLTVIGITDPVNPLIQKTINDNCK